MRAAQVLSFCCLLLAGHFTQSVLASQLQPKYDYKSTFSKKFLKIEVLNDIEIVKLQAQKQVSQVIAGQEGAYGFAWSLVKNITLGVARDGTSAAGALNLAAPSILKAACVYFQMCARTLPLLLGALGISSTVLATATPIVLVTLLIKHLFSNSGNITTEHLKGLTSHLTGSCYHGKNCGQSCELHWPPEDGLDEACYYHDVCLADYSGPRWHCDEELRQFTNYLRYNNATLTVKAGVVSDAMAHVLTKMTEGGDPGPTELFD